MTDGTDAMTQPTKAEENRSCSVCKREIDLGDECWMLTATEMTHDGPYHPGPYEVAYPLEVFCSAECIKTFAAGLTEAP